MKSNLVFTSLLLALLFVVASCREQSVAITNDDEQTEEILGNSVSNIGGTCLVVFQDSKSKHWFAGSDDGVFCYDGEELIQFSMKDGLCSNSVIGIQEDSKGVLYFDTQQGVSLFDGKTFRTLQVLDTLQAVADWKLTAEDLWFRMGWDKKGPYRYDGEFLHYLPFPETERARQFYAEFPNASYTPYGIYTSYRDRSGAVWFGTASLGACRYDGEQLTWLYESQLSTTPGGGDFGIRSIIEDQNGKFWFCNTSNRFVILPHDETKGTALNYQKELGIGFADNDGTVEYPYFMSAAEDKKGYLWLATYGNGVYRYDGERLKHYNINLGKEDVTLFSIYYDNEGVLWLASHNAGVLRLNGDTFEPFSL